VHEVVNISTLANAIQLSVAPVFLLAGIGGILNVMANRLARVVDRYRILSESSDENQAKDKEMKTLLLRERWVHWAIGLVVISALLLCIVVAALFIGTEIMLDPSRVVSLLFISAMLTIIAGLLCFLREINLATGTLGRLRK
jgi:hypothetical protein